MATIPALVLSLATAIIVARVTTDESAPEQATKQLGNPLAFGLAGGTLTLLGLIPGMPNAVFLSLGLSAIGLSYALKRWVSKKLNKMREMSSFRKLQKRFLIWIGMTQAR